MYDPTKPLLLDFFHLAWVMLAFGLLVYALIRRSNPLIRWHEHGNVWSEPFQAIDILMLTVILVMYYVGIRGVVAAEESSRAIEDFEIVPALLSSIMMMSFLAAGLISVLVFARRVRITELFGLKRLSIAQLTLWTVGLLVVTLPIIALVSAGWNSWLEYTYGTRAPQQELVTKMKESGGLGVKLLMAFSACVVAPITEEIIFRGYLSPATKRFTERLFAAIVISLFFAAIHGNTGSLIPLFFLAMALTIAYELTGSLLVPIAMHAIFNSITVIALFSSPPHG